MSIARRNATWNFDHHEFGLPVPASCQRLSTTTRERDIVRAARNHSSLWRSINNGFPSNSLPLSFLLSSSSLRNLNFGLQLRLRLRSCYTSRALILIYSTANRQLLCYTLYSLNFLSSLRPSSLAHFPPLRHLHFLTTMPLQRLHLSLRGPVKRPVLTIRYVQVHN